MSCSFTYLVWLEFLIVIECAIKRPHKVLFSCLSLERYSSNLLRRGGGGGKKLYYLSSTASIIRKFPFKAGD